MNKKVKVWKDTQKLFKISWVVGCLWRMGWNLEEVVRFIIFYFIFFCIVYVFNKENILQFTHKINNKNT